MKPAVPLLRALSVLAAWGAFLVSSACGQAQGVSPAWSGYSRDAQHTALSGILTQPLQRILWQTPVDLQPQYHDSDLYAHYGTPLVTKNNTVIVTVKTGATDGFKVEGHRSDTGELLWTHITDYSVPPHGWFPPCGGMLTPDNTLIVPGAGGTIYRITNPDQANPTMTQLAFYGLNNYRADPNTYNANVKICTPITSDSSGNLYFGFLVLGATSQNLQSGLARISSSGLGTWISVVTATGDATTERPLFSCAPALSNDGGTLYVAVEGANTNGYRQGYLVQLNSHTLAPVSKARLKDSKSGADANLSDDGTASPTVGPDGDVYFGVLEEPFGTNNYRGRLLHFNGDLSQTKIPGAFGWDDTASIVPASVVPSYTGTSAYLLLTKYNNYASSRGDGVNKLAVLDPNAQMKDPLSGVTVMKEVLTIAGPTPDWANRDAQHPNAVREWCINSAAVDPFTKSALVNNEDGRLYRWDFTTNTLTETVVLTSGIGEAYTPTLVGPDGTVYAINNAVLFAVGKAATLVTVSGKITLSGCVHPNQPVRMDFRRADGSASFLRYITLDATGGFSVSGVPAAVYNLAIKGSKWLQKVVSVDTSKGDVSGVTTTLLPGDVNNDNMVTILDLGLLADAFFTTPASPRWNANADLNCDNRVDILDLGLLADNFDKIGDP
jgi:hypothetical protein